MWNVVGHCFEDWEQKDHSMNELMNYKGVFRTAPATPGLLHTDIYYHPILHLPYMFN